MFAIGAASADASTAAVTGSGAMSATGAATAGGSTAALDGYAWFVGVGTQLADGEYSWCDLVRLAFPAGVDLPRPGSFRLSARLDGMIEMTYGTNNPDCLIRTILSPTIDSEAANEWY